MIKFKCCCCCGTCLCTCSRAKVTIAACIFWSYIAIFERALDLNQSIWLCPVGVMDIICIGSRSKVRLLLVNHKPSTTHCNCMIVFYALYFSNAVASILLPYSIEHILKALSAVQRCCQIRSKNKT